MKNFSALSTFFVIVILAACTNIAFAQVPVKVVDGMLTNPAGMTLYTFDKDVEGKSACYGTCAANWASLTAQDSDKASGDYSIMSRDDGKKQWAYKGKALYTWAKDNKPGDKTGDGVNGIWHVAKP